MLNFLSAVCCIGGSDGKVHLGKKTLAVDYGLRRVGLALSVGIAPRRLNKIYNRGNLGEVARRISDVARREMVLQVVVGLPLNSKGDEGEQAAATRKFCEYLRIALPEPPIYLWDERFSTQTARNRLMSSSATVLEITPVLFWLSRACKELISRSGTHTLTGFVFAR
uniref:YqgF/RNase H-like domain-containing protein n=1 Tax=Rhodosorus marinus TaxID=101924 RepID=A0A7S3E813_9RHOD|mmetsp:Transcript_15484/g.63163  ORF Transcript_15484/g.63163 Transcript_15484/m.63163 type:complete len:167 (+) Transcript_15484:190-690(+)